MSLSISQRLAAMYAAASLLTLALVSLALHGLLARELERHQAAELATRVDVNRPLIGKTGRAADWNYVQHKFAAMTPDDGRIRYWVLSDDPRFTHGIALTPAQHAALRSDGYAALADPLSQEPMKVLVRTIASKDERPAVRLMVGMRSAPFTRTLQTFTAGLVALTLVGTALAALLGYYIARLGLRPIARLSLAAQTLTPERLSQRLERAPLPSELSELTASFNGALDRLESAYQQLEAFNADVAHELRTPLTNLIGQTQVALARERNAVELQEVMYSNLEELERLRAIVNDMLFLARADRGETAPHRVEVSLAREIDRTVQFLELLLEEAGMHVSITGDARADIETALFGRAVTNLLQNAIEHAPAGSRLQVELTQQDGGARIAVCNPGAQIAPEHLPRLFDRFYRVDRARSGSRDSHGLGLAIVKAVARMHGGTVFAASEGQTTTIGFTVRGRATGSASGAATQASAVAPQPARDFATLAHTARAPSELR